MTRNVLPRPISLSTAISPPSALRMPLQIQSPSPVPSPAGLVVKNGSKIRSRISGGIPTPVSRTSTTARPRPSVRVLTRISLRSVSPSGMACAALSSRFRNTWPEARLVALDHRRVAVVLHQARAVADLVPGDVDRRIEHAAQRDRPALLLVAAREHPQVAHDVADALGALARLGQRLARLVERRAPGRRRRPRCAVEPRRDVVIWCRDEVDVRDDVGERVVDLVRDAGRQRPHRRHPPGEDQLVLHPPAIGQVADEEVVALGTGTAAVQLAAPARSRAACRTACRPCAHAVDLALDLLVARRADRRAASARSAASTQSPPSCARSISAAA